MFLDWKLSQAGQKQQSISVNSFYSNTSYGFECKKHCLSKLSIKIFIKRKTKARKVFVNRMLLSFETSVAYKNFLLTSRRTTVSVVKQLLSNISRFFARHCPMSGANI